MSLGFSFAVCKLVLFFYLFLSAVCEQVLFKPSPNPIPSHVTILQYQEAGKPVIDLSFETDLKPVLFIIRLVKDELDQAY